MGGISRRHFCGLTVGLASIPAAAAAVRRLAKRRGVTVTGRVPDTRPYMDEAELFIAPMRMARGIQNKLLEALAMGFPCVASQTAARGTVVQDGEGILAADDPEEFAEHVVRLLRDGAFRAAMASKARAGRSELPVGSTADPPRSGHCISFAEAWFVGCS